MRSWRRGALCAAVVLASVICGLVATSAVARGLPDGRRYELVSPPDKNGADVLLTSERTRVATDGNAFGFAALAGFADAREVAVASDYVSVRSTLADPGSNGWATHGIAPPQRSLALGDVLAGQEPLYTGAYSPGLTTGVFFASSPLTGDPMVAAVPNLYRRTDLLTPGLGAYDLLTGCPACTAPLDPSGDSISRARARPLLAGASPDVGHVAFESARALTADAPPQPAGCNPTRFPFSFVCAMRLYEWDHGTVRLAGILPDGSAADESFAGQGAVHAYLTPGVVSDGSDGHARVFFTQPTDGSGGTVSQSSGLGAAIAINQSPGGNVFMRVDHAVTVQLNTSERTTADAFAPASFLDASTDGTRSFFMTTQALTDDAPADGTQKIYMYDATASGPDHLTLIDRDSESGDGTADALGLVGISHDGHYVYFVSNGQLISGGPLSGSWIYLWHDGQLSLVGPAGAGNAGGIAVDELLATGYPWVLAPQQAQASANGGALLFSAFSGTGLTGYDHGSCHSQFTSTGGCRELYVYSADGSTPLRPVIACASCNPSGAPAVGMAAVHFGDNTVGGTRGDTPQTQAVTDDGSRVFFSSPDALVPEAVNGRYNAYEYDVRTRTVSLLSSGTSTSDSYFVNATPSGNDAFVITREPLVGWDRDQAYDIYDARVNGGFPEPPPAALPCSGDACHGLPQPVVAYSPPDSSSYAGGGDLHASLKPHRRPRRSVCGRGRVLRRVRGKRRCVRAPGRRRVTGARSAHKHGRRS